VAFPIKVRVGEISSRTILAIKRLDRLVCIPLILLAAVAISADFADATTSQVLLPIEVFSASSSPESRIVTLQTAEAGLVQSLWLQIHGLRYADQASIQVNNGLWIPLSNDTVTVAEPGRSFGGIGGGFATLVIILPLPADTVASGTNTVRFRFNRSDGFVSAYRVLALNFLTREGQRLLPPGAFEEDAPESWTPPLSDPISIRAGQELWNTASLVSSSLPDSRTIQAHCADCHARNGRDLKYFNFSNASIIARSRFHALSRLQGEQIASYIRSLQLPNPGRPWNPPYQPGPGIDAKPVSNWAAGAGLAWVLNQDADALPYLLEQGDRVGQTASNASENSRDLRELVGRITPDIFRPDGNLNAREIPIALQLPDWSGWLPRVHPKDAWGSDFDRSEFAQLYGGELLPEKGEPPLRTLLAAAQARDQTRFIINGFSKWSQARNAFLGRFIKPKAPWSPELTNKVYSAQLWQLVKTWEMMQEYGLEARGRDFFGSIADSRSWCNTIPAETAPSSAQIPDGPAGVGGSALTNEYFIASWYELQIVLNSGNHQHRDRSPVDWVYLIGRFRDLYSQTQQPEPARLIVATIKALQSTDPHLGPDNLSRGWRPDQNVDPRIMISPIWAPLFKPLPTTVHRALTASLLAAWLDKNLQYPIARYLPVSGIPLAAYTTPRSYGDISGGKVWEAAQQFREAGVSATLVARLQEWGTMYADRAARIQYGGISRH